MAEGQPRITTAGSRAAAVYALMIGALVLLYLWIRSYGDTLGAPRSRRQQPFRLGRVARESERPAARAARAGGGDRDRARDGLDLPQLPISRRWSAKSSRASCSARRCSDVSRPAPKDISSRRRSGRFSTSSRKSASSFICSWSGSSSTPSLLRKRGHSTVAISHASIIAPFLLGATISLYLYPKLSTSDVPFTCFSLFLGVSMSVTAFPVLARILTDRRIHKTHMGAIALTCAAVDDVTAWCMLAFVVSVARAQATGAVTTIAMALGFIAADDPRGAARDGAPVAALRKSRAAHAGRDGGDIHRAADLRIGH